MKACSVCKILKPITEFSKDRYKKDNLCVSCKSCNTARRNGIIVERPPAAIILTKQCKVCNAVKLKEEFRGRTCKQCIVDQRSVPVIREYSTKPQSIRKRKLRQASAIFKLRSNIGTAIANIISAKGFIKQSSTEEILGCSIIEFHDHIESQFVQGMSWENRSEWHIDHIVPVKLATTEEQVIQLNHFSNLRPLWKADNLQKSAKITEEVISHKLYIKLFSGLS